MPDYLGDDQRKVKHDEKEEKEIKSLDEDLADSVALQTSRKECVGVDRNKYQIHIPLPPKIDPTVVTMMQVEEKPDVTYSDVGDACLIFFDEIDAIGGARFDDGAGGDNEVQRTMLELINQLDGFDPRGNIKVLMATNRPDTLDPALMRPGRLDRRLNLACQT
ncbi:26S proteasome regulatory subunit 7 [Eumeta japonica]|uniref:26S proteasome regulatory subunit 7 n=1 Tax=Eumeta variegata TaxID=151549 RepID=A0A4C1TT52_EUMVA|nr:26S proteasome regulatory subunit 7 [Eumeta japonica]